jgi:hypothetical protein
MMPDPDKAFDVPGASRERRTPKHFNGTANYDIAPVETCSFPRGIHILSPRECELVAAPEYVWKGICARGNHTGVIGEPGAGKSALVACIGYRVAQGIGVFGHRTRKVSVLYIAAEDGHGMTQRVRALFKTLGDAPNFHLQPAPVNFLSQDTKDIPVIEELISRLQPGLIIVDTIAAAFPGLAENDADEMSRVVKVARGFTRICNSAVLTTHHTPKGGTTPRGHSVLNGDYDATLYVSGERDQPRTVSMGKNRNGPSSRTYSFTLISFPLGTDADGDLVTAVLAEPSAIENAASKLADKEKLLRDAPAIMLRELRDLLGREGQMVKPDSDHPSVKAVERASLRRRLIDRGWFRDDVLSREGNTVTGLLRPGFGDESNALKALKAKGFISHTRDWVWCI